MATSYLFSNNQDMSREEFFKLMGGAFRQALSQILDGKDLLPLSKFVDLQTSDDEDMESPSITLREVDVRANLILQQKKIQINSNKMHNRNL